MAIFCAKLHKTGNFQTCMTHISLQEFWHFLAIFEPYQFFSYKKNVNVFF